jgi:TP901 family phage tail tape measure protein
MPIGSGLFSQGLASAGGGATRVGAAFVELFADTRGLRTGFAQGEAMLKSFGTRLAMTGAVTQRVGAAWSRNLTLPLVAIGGVATKMAVDFETAMARTSALAGIAERDLSMFRAEVMRLAGETAQAPKDLADALYLVGSAGLRDSQVLPVLEAAAKGAAAQIGDAATLGHLLSGVLVAWADEAPTAAQAMDVITEAIKQGKAEPADLASHLGTVVPVAAQMGVAFDEVAGAIAAATNVNIEAARAATGLRYMLIQLQNPTETAKDLMEDYGLTARQVQNWIEDDLISGLIRLGDTFDLTTAKGREAFFTTIGGVRSGQVALALMGESAERTQQIMDATARAAGDSAEEFEVALEKMKATPGFQMQKAWNDLRVAAIDAGVILLPLATEIVQAVADVARAFSDLDEGTQSTIIRIGLLVAAFGPLLNIWGRLVGLAGRVVLALTNVGAATSAAKVGAMGTAAMQATQMVPAAPMVLPPLARGPNGRFMSLRGVTPVGWQAGAAGAMAPVVPGVLPATATGAAAAKGSAGAALAGWGLGFAQQAMIGTAAIAGLGVALSIIEDATTSMDDLAKETGITAENLSMFEDRVREGATRLNPFTSTTDKAREAGEIFNEVAQDLADTLGISLWDAQRRVNEQFEMSMEDIGGLTGSIDTLEQNLRGRLGLLETGDAVTLLTRRFEAMVDAASVTTGGPLGISTEIDWQTFEAQEFVAALRSVKASGLEVEAVFGDQLRKALDDQVIRWEQVVSWWSRAGMVMPYRQAGRFAQAIFEVNDATAEQRRAVADSLGLLREYGVQLTDGARSMVGSSIASGNLADTLDVLNRVALRGVTESILENTDALNERRNAVLAAALAEGDYLGALRALRRFERQDARELERARAAGFRLHGEDLDPTAAAGADVRRNLAAVEDFLDTREDIKGWGDTLRDAVGMDPADFRLIGGLAEDISNAGVAFDELDKKTQRKLEVAIESGDAEATIALLLDALLELDRTDAEPQVNVGGNAETKLAQIRSSLAVLSGTTTTHAIDFVLHGQGNLAAPPPQLPYNPTDSQTGGWVPGAGTGDHVPMMLEPKEFVVRRRQARKYAQLLEAINSGRFDFYRPNDGSAASSPITTMRRSRLGAPTQGGGDLHVHVAGKMEYEPRDLARNLDGWLRRRGRG